MACCYGLEIEEDREIDELGQSKLSIGAKLEEGEVGGEVDGGDVASIVDNNTIPIPKHRG